MKDTPQAIGTRLKVFRTDFLKFTQKQFAERVETTQANISQIEKSVCLPAGNFLTRLIYHFPDINLNWVFYGEGQMTRQEPILVGDPDLKDEIFRLQKEVKILKEENSALIKMLYRYKST